MKMNAQFVILGTGDYEYEKYFTEAAFAHHGRASVVIKFDTPLSHKIYAASDVFLMPSKSEPCGLAQMFSMRYGTIPIVRSTGGLHDSVHDFAGENGNGFDFFSYTHEDMLVALYRAAHDYFDKPLWEQHIKAAMASDFSWRASASEYIALYKEVVSWE
jgi:starch synthase